MIVKKIKFYFFIAYITALIHISITLTVFGLLYVTVFELFLQLYNKYMLCFSTLGISTLLLPLKAINYFLK